MDQRGFKAKENEDGDMVLTKEYYEELVEDSELLSYLHEAGVDNWEGYSYAFDMRRERD